VGALSFIASLAVVDAIKGLGLDPAIKWPNDVLVDRKKVAGALAECATRDDRIEHVILGVGVNLNVTREMLVAGLGAEARAAGSLRSAANHDIDRNAFAAAFLSALDAWFRLYRDYGSRRIVAEWRDHDIVGGRRIEVRGEAKPYEGRALGVNAEGYLVVREPRGTRRRVRSGEIRLLD
jgi:BirA family biotin operon repressor/biotin-[acetyl-CoA-carboxylase] ligase